MGTLSRFCTATLFALLLITRSDAQPVLALTSQAPTASPLNLRFELNALNTTTQTMTWQPPVELHCIVVSSNNSVAAIANRISAPPDSSLQPGTFASATYELPLTDPLRDGVIVQVREVPGTSLRFTPGPPSNVAETEPAGGDRGLLYVLRGRGHAIGARDYEPNLFFKQHIFGHEPLYFIAGTESPNAKFQISFKYRLLNEHGWLAERAPLLGGFYLGYSQTSLWDWNARSAPFFDSSYRPELLFARDEVFRSGNGWFTMDLQGGIQHESNGRSGDDSRSLNIAYVRPRFTIGPATGLQLTLAPRAWVYVGDLSDNPDIEDYRGYVDLRATVGWKRGLQVSALGRLGDDWDHGSATLDVTYPLMQPPYGALSLYLHAQYFIGYGESLIGYRERTDQFRAGISLFR